MMTEGDRKTLLFSAYAPAWWSVASIFTVGLLLFQPAMYLYVAARLGEPLGLTLSDLISRWATRDFGLQVAGLEALALLNIERALGASAVALICLVGLVAGAYVRRRDQRIVETLRTAGLI